MSRDSKNRTGDKKDIKREEEQQIYDSGWVSAS